MDERPILGLPMLRNPQIVPKALDEARITSRAESTWLKIMLHHRRRKHFNFGGTELLQLEQFRHCLAKSISWCGVRVRFI